MVLSATQFTDNLMSAPAICGYALLVLFFLGELVTHLLGPAPSSDRGRRRGIALYAVASPRLDRWSSHHVAVLEPSDRREESVSMRDWPRLVSQPEQVPDADSEAERPEDEAAELQRQAFARWLIERGRLGEWSAESDRKPEPHS